MSAARLEGAVLDRLRALVADPATLASETNRWLARNLPKLRKQREALVKQFPEVAADADRMLTEWSAVPVGREFVKDRIEALAARRDDLNNGIADLAGRSPRSKPRRRRQRRSARHRGAWMKSTITSSRADARSCSNDRCGALTWASSRSRWRSMPGCRRIKRALACQQRIGPPKRKCGSPTWIRTTNLPVNSRALYR